MVRFKNRYLLCHIEADAEHVSDVRNLDTRDISQLVRSSIFRNFGDLAYGQLISSLAVKLWSPALSLCLIRCSRDHFRTAWAAITFITSLTQKNTHPLPATASSSMLESVSPVPSVRFTVIHVGGTIRSCQKSAIDYSRQLILRARMNEYVDTTNLQIASVSLQRQLEQEQE